VLKFTQDKILCVTVLLLLWRSSKRLVNTWCIAPHEHELEHQSGASALMICTASLWKSSHACSDGAKVLVRDSTGHHSGSALVGSGSFVGLTGFCDCFCTVLLCIFRVCFVRFLRGINRLLLVASSGSPQRTHSLSSCASVHTVSSRRIGSAPAGSSCAIRERARLIK